MNRLDEIYRESREINDYSVAYTKHLIQLLEQLDHDAVTRIVKIFINAWKNKNKILFIGNGGSAATSSHFANDIGFGIRHIPIPFRAMSLTDNTAVLTAIANDDGYENVFEKQLKLIMAAGDIVVAISASGNSANLVRACEYTKELGNQIIGLLGFDGGKLADICDEKIVVKTRVGEYGPVEDIHMILDHLISSYLARFVLEEK